MASRTVVAALLAVFACPIDAVLAAPTGGASTTDLWARLSDEHVLLPGGQSVELVLAAGNFSTGGTEVDADVAFPIPDHLTATGWTCAGVGMATCPPSGGPGDLGATVHLPPGDWVEFTISVDVEESQGSLVEAVATIAVNGIEIDPNPANNSASLAQKIGIYGNDFEPPQAHELFDPADLDGDGWTPATGDCCEDVKSCPDPAMVNPGAVEVLGNSVDDDCDVSTDDETMESCSAVAKFGGVTAGDLANAMGLCRTTTLSEPWSTRTWGVLSAEFLNANGSAPGSTALAQMGGAQTAVLVDYGTGGIVPTTGGTMAGMSTGWMRDKSDPGYVAPNFGTGFGRYGAPPASYLASHGGVLPTSASCEGTCPSGSGANDSVNLKLKIRVPTNARGFSYDWRFFSSEYWTYSCSTFNDFTLALLDSSISALPADHNIAFDALGNPASVNNDFFSICTPKGCHTCPLGTGALVGTGMEDSMTGGGTPWLTTTAPAVPGEILELQLMVFDVSDDILDSLILLDGFQWLAEDPGVTTGPQ